MQPRHAYIFEPLSSFTEKHGLLLARSVAQNNGGLTVVRIHSHEKPDISNPCKRETVYSNTTSPDSLNHPVHTENGIISELLQKAEGLSVEQKEHLRVLLIHGYMDIISQNDGDLGQTTLLQHSIHTSGATPIRSPPRRLPFHQRQETKQLVEDMLQKEVIEPSQSPWSSPIVLVKKKDGSTRFCVDFRRLNGVTQKDAQPIPRIDDTLDTLSGACWFSTLDLASGYWQVQMNETDKEILNPLWALSI